MTRQSRNRDAGGGVGTKRRTEITIQTDRFFVLSRRTKYVTSWCARCGQTVRMIPADEAAAIAGVSSRTIYRWADDEKLHFTETPDGRLLICPESIPAAGPSLLAHCQS